MQIWLVAMYAAAAARLMSALSPAREFGLIRQKRFLAANMSDSIEAVTNDNRITSKGCWD
jgi:hypothetical protein